jgi:hypothetical protein
LAVIDFQRQGTSLDVPKPVTSKGPGLTLAPIEKYLKLSTWMTGVLIAVSVAHFSNPFY